MYFLNIIHRINEIMVELRNPKSRRETPEQVNFHRIDERRLIRRRANRGRIFQTRVSSPNVGEEWRLPSADKDKSLSRRKESGFRVDSVYTLHGGNSGRTVASSTTQGVCSGKYTFVRIRSFHIRNHLRASRYLHEVRRLCGSRADQSHNVWSSRYQDRQSRYHPSTARRRINGRIAMTPLLESAINPSLDYNDQLWFSREAYGMF